MLHYTIQQSGLNALQYNVLGGEAGGREKSPEMWCYLLAVFPMCWWWQQILGVIQTGFMAEYISIEDYFIRHTSCIFLPDLCCRRLSVLPAASFILHIMDGSLLMSPYFTWIALRNWRFFILNPFLDPWRFLCISVQSWLWVHIFKWQYLSF